MSELMSAMQLTTFPIVALVIFLVTFTAVMARVFRRGSKAELNRHGLIPLDDERSPPTGSRRA